MIISSGEVTDEGKGGGNSKGVGGQPCEAAMLRVEYKRTY